MKTLIASYLQSKAQAWSPTTLKTVATKLAMVDPAYLPSDPASCHADLVRQGYGAYTIKQVMLLAAQACKHGVLSGEIAHETYTQFMHDRKRLFNDAYAPKRVPATFDDTLEKIKTKLPERSRAFALGLIASGLRISEAANVTVDGQVVGKGNKVRSVPNADMVTSAPVGVCMMTFRRDLKNATGLTPHQLRKLAATMMVKFGAREADLCAMMGWSSFQTASIYLQAENVADVTARLKGAIGDAK